MPGRLGSLGGTIGHRFIRSSLTEGLFLLATESGRLVANPSDKPTVARIPWVHIFDSSANVAIAGDRFLLVGDLNLSFIVVDLATLRKPMRPS